MGSRIGSWVLARRRWIEEASGLTLAFLLLTLGMTYPLVNHLRDAVPGPPWDNLVWLYDLQWFKSTVFEHRRTPLFNPWLFAPFGYDLTLSETMLANKLLVAPFLALGSAVLAYNTLLLLSFVLTGLGTYLLVHELTASRPAAFVSGVILAFAPYRMHAMGAGWLPLISTQWLPLLFWSMERGARRCQSRWFVLAGALLAANVLSSWYYIYVVAPFAALYLLLRWRPWRGRPLAALAAWNLLLMLVVAAAIVAPVAIPVLRGARGQMAWPLSEVEKWSASAEDFLLPQIYHPLWGRAVLATRPNVPSYPWYAPGFVALGFLPLGLALLGLWRNRAELPIMPLLVCAALSFVLALGTTLHWSGERLYIAVPQAFERLFSRAMYVLMGRLALNKASYAPLQRPGAVPVPLPGLLLYLYLPFASALRTMYRFGLITIFSVAVLAGYGVRALLTMLKSLSLRLREAQFSPARRAARPGTGRARLEIRAWLARIVTERLLTGLAVAVLALLVCLEFAIAPLGYGYTRIVEQPLDRWLAAQPRGAVVAQFPLARALNGSSLYRWVTHQQPMAYGHGTFYPAAYLEAKPVLDRFPSPETLDLLKSWGVRYVVVGVGAYEAGWGDQPGQTWARVASEIAQSGRLRWVYTTQELPVWHEDRVADLIQGNLPVQPIVIDQVQVYELE